MRRQLRTGCALLVLLAGGGLAGCGGGPPPAPPPATLALSASGAAIQNPTQAGAPAPVSVRLFQLAGTDRFDHADVFALTDRPQATLGEDLLATDQFALAPGEVHPVAGPLKPGARFLGAVALFRDIDHATWRATVPLAPQGPSRLALHTEGLTVTLAPQAPAKKGGT